jgi:hypothetical protein
MNVTIRVVIETDLQSLAKVLMLTELPDKPRPSHVRAAAGEILARYGLHGALRRYDRQLRDLAHADDVRDHETTLAWCRTLAAQAFPPPKPRHRAPRPAPMGRPLMEILASD